MEIIITPPEGGGGLRRNEEHRNLTYAAYKYHYAQDLQKEQEKRKQEKDITQNPKDTDGDYPKRNKQKLGKGNKQESSRQQAKTGKCTLPDNKNRKAEQQHQPTSRTEQDAEAEKKTTNQNHADWRQAAYVPKAATRRENISKGNKMTLEQEPNYGHASPMGTIQTTEGRYEERPTSDNSNNCPIQKKMHLARYSISRPPRAMRNIPKY